MNHKFAMMVILSGSLLAGGCATKKYVRNTAAPIQSKVDQVAETQTKQGTTLEEARKAIEVHETGINAAKERAMSAENRANDAMNQANKADQNAMQAQNLANKASQDVGALRENVNNQFNSLDNYQMAAEVSVPFAFNSSRLTQKSKQELDDFLAQHGNLKRYYIVVAGYTDRTGSPSYNEELSRRRAEQVVEYLVAKHDVPIYRIQRVGLGKEKPADEGRNRASRAKNRRVEVKIFSADQMSAMSQPPQTQQPPTGSRSRAVPDAKQ